MRRGRRGWRAWTRCSRPGRTGCAGSPASSSPNRRARDEKLARDPRAPDGRAPLRRGEPGAEWSPTVSEVDPAACRARRSGWVRCTAAHGNPGLVDGPGAAEWTAARCGALRGRRPVAGSDGVSVSYATLRTCCEIKQSVLTDCYLRGTNRAAHERSGTDAAHAADAAATPFVWRLIPIRANSSYSTSIWAPKPKNMIWPARSKPQ